MQRFSSHLNGFAACEEVCNAAVPLPSMSRRRPPVVCPKPRRVGQWVVPDLARDLRSSSCCNQAGEMGDNANGAELMEIFLRKDSFGELVEKEQQSQPWSLLSSSPPYFCGSPPRRASNPLIHDPNFLQGKQHQQTNNTLTQSPFLEQPYTATTTPLATRVAAQFPIQPPSVNSAASGYYPATATSTAAGGGRRQCLPRSSDNFGPGVATVTVVGFDCFNRRDNRGCSISAFA